MMKEGITPNQFYLLFSMKEGISPLGINISQELRALTGKWTNDNKLTSKATDLITQIESYFRVQKKKTSVQVMGTDFSINIEKYNTLFPRKKLPSGKVGRSALSNVETNFRWFFDNHQFSWETILKATEMYIEEYEIKSPAYMFMRTSAYFIRKTELDKSIVSDLANYCDIVESGEDLNEGTRFTQKVV